MDDPFPIPLKFGAEIVGVFLVFPAKAFLTAGGVGGEERGLLLFKILPSADRHEIVMDDRLGESRDGKFSEEQGVKKRGTEGNKLSAIRSEAKTPRLRLSLAPADPPPPILAAASGEFKGPLTRRDSRLRHQEAQRWMRKNVFLPTWRIWPAERETSALGSDSFSPANLMPP